MRLVFISSVIATTVLRITSAVKASTAKLVFDRDGDIQVLAPSSHRRQFWIFDFEFWIVGRPIKILFRHEGDEDPAGSDIIISYLRALRDLRGENNLSH